MNDIFLRVLKGEQTDRTPIWLMRQAGRYLPEYRATRAKAGSFLELCQNAELACEVTLQPLERFHLDAAILFSDILTVPDAMGLGLYFTEGEGPKFQKALRHERDILNLPIVDPADSLGYVLNAVSTIKKALNGRVPLIGFSGSPWTLACYMVEGGSSKDFRFVKTMLYARPDLLTPILEKTAESVALYLQAQIAAGADCVMIFDTWGGVLTQAAYEEFSLKWMRHVLQKIPADTPSIIFTKGGGQWLEKMAGSGASALGIDWQTDIQNAFARVGGKVALQGNLDPAILSATPQAIESEATRILNAVPANGRHIFNLGHGILPHTPPENVRVLADCVHNFQKN